MTAPIVIDRLDHLVLTIADLDTTCEFYVHVLGMEKVVFGADNRVGLSFGAQKINLHPAGNEYEPRATTALPGTGDVCLITETPIADVVLHLENCGIEIILGPVPKTGATGAITSVYFRDPDGNLIEVSNYA